MSSIYVCNLVGMPDHAETLKVSHLVSLVSPDEQPPMPACIALERHHRVGIHDISEPLDGHILPALEHIEGLIEFVRASQHDEAPILIHCVATLHDRVEASPKLSATPHGRHRSGSAPAIGDCSKPQGQARGGRRNSPRARWLLWAIARQV
jgi:hypothetical protein